MLRVKWYFFLPRILEWDGNDVSLFCFWFVWHFMLCVIGWVWPLCGCFADCWLWSPATFIYQEVEVSMNCICTLLRYFSVCCIARIESICILVLPIFCCQISCINCCTYFQVIPFKASVAFCLYSHFIRHSWWLKSLDIMVAGFLDALGIVV